jgi:hypothetical protein
VRRRRIGVGLAIAVAVVGVVAHVAYWYAPRWHALEVERARLLPASPEADEVLWVPFPHQNLGALDGAVEDADAVVAAAGRLLGTAEISIPRLRPFGVPAAHEVEIEWRGAAAPTVRVAAYPSLRWVARAAGRLAGNPWLAGGEVRAGEEPRRVRWSEGVWELGSGNDGSAPRPETPAPAGSAPVWLRFAEQRPGGALPQGVYDLTVVERALRLGPTARALDPPETSSRVVLFVVDRREGGTRCLMLVAGGGVQAGAVTLPGLAATAGTRDEAVEVLPAGRWLDGLFDLPSAIEPGKGVSVATDASLLPLTTEVLEAWGEWMDGEGLVGIAWLRPGPAAEMAGVVTDLLDDLPFVPQETRRRWRDATLVLDAATELESVLVAAPSPG